MRHKPARFDIEAMRAFAVTTVIMYHGGLPPFDSGFVGVDIFFVISGYLIIGLLYREYMNSGGISLLDFWARRARRLLPAAATVVSVTAIAAWVLVSRLNIIDVRYDLAAAALYAANIRFGATGSDYWAPQYVSPALHFWSLGVEEQFYIAAPLFMLLVHLIFWALSMKRMATVLQVALLATTAGSLAYCLNLSATEPVWAYYSTSARAWEFAVGGLAAAVAAPVRLSTKFNTFVRMLLWGVLIASAVVINPLEGWPGLATVPAVVASAMLMWLGGGLQTEFFGRLAKLRSAIGWLGGISYSAYLWHWPLFWAAAMFTVAGGMPEGLAPGWAIGLTAVTLLLAHLTKRFVEDPIRFRPFLVHSPRASLLKGAEASLTAVMIVGVTAMLPAVGWQGSQQIAAPKHQEQQPPTESEAAQNWLKQQINALLPVADPNNSTTEVVPALADAPRDWASIDRNGCHASLVATDLINYCTYGSADPTRTVMLFGDSHAESLFDGLNDAAEKLQVALLPRTRSACPAADVTVYAPKLARTYTECDLWRKAVIAEIAQQKPNLVIIMSRRPIAIYDRTEKRVSTDPTRISEVYRAGLKRTLYFISKHADKVIVIRDLPRFEERLPKCLESKSFNRCAVAKNKAVPPATLDIKVANDSGYALGLDFTRAFCNTKICFPVRGGTLIARDEVHLTKTYSELLTPVWRQLLVREIGAS